MSRNKSVSNQLLGRDELLTALWTELDHRSLLLSGPRRIGKTELLRAMATSPARGWRTVRVDVEGLKTFPEAVEEIERVLRRENLLSSSVRDAMSRVEEVSIAGSGMKLRDAHTSSPGVVLELLLEQTLDNLPDDTRFLLALDEVPWWLDEIRAAEGGQAARRTLATLRRLRQRQGLASRVRMLLTGSIGLAGLAKELNASAELNDLQPEFEVPPLSESAGAALFESEVATRGHHCSPASARAAHGQAGGSPHWIKVLAGMAAARVQGTHLEESHLAEAIAELLHPRMREQFDDEGRAHLIRRHGKARARRMVAILDAVADQPAPEHVLASAAMKGVDPPERREIRELIYTLMDEHYITEDRSVNPPQYRFVNPLFQLWWQRYGGAL